MLISQSNLQLQESKADANAATSELPEMGPDSLLHIEDLHTYFTTEEGVVRAVDGVTLGIQRQKVLGVVGESGCGKSITALSTMQLIPRPKGKIHSGHIFYNRDDKGVLDLAAQDPLGPVMRSIRGNEIAMIFQEPMTSLNPDFTVGDQIVEAVQLHRNISKKEAWDLTL